MWMRGVAQVALKSRWSAKSGVRVFARVFPGNDDVWSSRLALSQQRRALSSNNNNSNKSSSFRPHRKSSRNYRPVPKGSSPKKKHLKLKSGGIENPAHGERLAAGIVEELRRERELRQQFPAAYSKLDEAEEDLRMADYWTAEQGTWEEMAFERRALDNKTNEERAKFLEDIDLAVREGERMTMNIEDESFGRPLLDPKGDERRKLKALIEQEEEEDEDEHRPDIQDEADLEDNEFQIDENQLAFGEWSEMLIGVNRGIKLWRGGRMESYRAIMIGGNMNGCGGFGIGKSPDPIKAVDLAGRNAKRNIFFVDRYNGDGITTHLVGKMNDTKVVIRANDSGLRGNELCGEILMRFGIVNASCKAYGNRHPWNVVRATFKALMTHESIEDIALKRGKRLVNLDRAMRMQI